MGISVVFLVLAIIVLISVITLIAMMFWPNQVSHLSKEASSLRNAQLIENAMTQFQIDHMEPPDTKPLPTDPRSPIPICTYHAKDASQCYVIDSLVPQYLPSIPHADEIAANDDQHTGFAVYVTQGSPQVVDIYDYTLAQSRAAGSVTSSSSSACGDLLGYWPLDEAQDTSTFADVSGKGNDGRTLPYCSLGGPDTQVPGALRGADPRSWRFGGSGAILIADNPSLNVSGAFTFSAWVNTSWTSEKKEHRFLFGGRREEKPYAGFAVAISGKGGLAYFSNLSQESARWITGSGTVNDGQWHHVAVSVSALGTVDLYRDGVRTLEKQGAPPSLYRGPRAIGATSAATDSLPGMIDDVRLYDRVLSAADIALLASGKQASCGAGTDAKSVTTGTFACGTCVDRKGRTVRCKCAYDALGNVVTIGGVSPDPQQLGVTILCPAHTVISTATATYGGNCTSEPARCPHADACIGQTVCAIPFSNDTCLGGVFPANCPALDGKVSFLCSN